MNNNFRERKGEREKEGGRERKRGRERESNQKEERWMGKRRTAKEVKEGERAILTCVICSLCVYIIIHVKLFPRYPDISGKSMFFLA